MTRAIHFVVMVGIVAGIVVSVVTWMLPVDLAMDLAVTRTAWSTLAEFERAGRAEAIWMFCRVAGPLLLIVSLAARRGRLLHTVRDLIEGWRQTTTASVSVESSTSSTHAANTQSRSLTALIRVCIVAWIGLAVLHAGACLWRRIEDWPVYRFRSGHTVLPNISQQNRDVIHYLQSVTPPDSRLFVISDQKLYFVSYYVLPRRVYHLTHPDGEFRIPAGYGARTIPTLLEADLPAGYLETLDPDYIVEYLESSKYMDPDRMYDDASWIAFQRARYGPGYQPTYQVSVRPYQSGAGI